MMCGRPQGSRTGSTKLKSRRDEIIEFLKKGFSYCAIAKQTGVHQSTVKKYCLENNLVKFHDKKFDGRFVNKYSTQTAIEKVATQRELLSKIKSGLTYAEIGKLYGIHAASIRKYIQERKRLYQEYLSVQNKKRIASNGGLRINKGYKGLK